MPRALWWSWGGAAVSYERSTPESMARLKNAKYRLPETIGALGVSVCDHLAVQAGRQTTGHDPLNRERENRLRALRARPCHAGPPKFVRVVAATAYIIAISSTYRTRPVQTFGRARTNLGRAAGCELLARRLRRSVLGAIRSSRGALQCQVHVRTWAS